MDYTGDDIYCDVIIPRKADLKIIKETDTVLAYYHTRPHWETHIIVTPKKHVLDFVELAQGSGTLARELLDVVAEIAESVKRDEGGCSVFTTLGDNQNAKHLHIHVRNGPEL